MIKGLSCSPTGPEEGLRNRLVLKFLVVESGLETTVSEANSAGVCRSLKHGVLQVVSSTRGLALLPLGKLQLMVRLFSPKAGWVRAPEP